MVGDMAIAIEVFQIAFIVLFRAFSCNEVVKKTP